MIEGNPQRPILLERLYQGLRFLSNEAAVRETKVDFGSEGVTRINPDTPYAPFSSFDSIGPDGHTLSKWQFVLDGIPGRIVARHLPPLPVVDEDGEPATAPMGITNTFAFEPFEGGEDVTFSIVVEPNSYEQYDKVLKRVVALFRFGDELFWCGLEGDNLIDDEEFNDTDELYADLQDGKRRRLENWIMRQAPGEFYQVTVPRKVNSSEIRVTFTDKVSILYLMELNKDRKLNPVDVEQLTLGLK